MNVTSRTLSPKVGERHDLPALVAEPQRGGGPGACRPDSIAVQPHRRTAARGRRLVRDEPHRERHGHSDRGDRAGERFHSARLRSIHPHAIMTTTSATGMTSVIQAPAVTSLEAASIDITSSLRRERAAGAAAWPSV